MKIALAQFNPTVGDLAGNSAKIADFIDRAAAAGAELVVFGELSIMGYPPRDLLRKEQFVADNVAAVEALARRCTKIAALVGFVRPTPDGKGRPLQNAAAMLEGGRIRHVHVKSLLPTYDVFDESRYFQPGEPGQCVELGGRRLGISICEDLWDAEALGRELYGVDPIAALSKQGAQVIINMAASPFHVGKARLREELFSRQARRVGLPIIYVNQVGGNDELIFDGGSCLISAAGEVLGRAASFREDLLVVDVDGGPTRCEEQVSDIASLSAALKLGLADYVRKCGFSGMVMGLSGGIDSSVTAVLAADALGPKNVTLLAMPSRYSSGSSLADAKTVAANIGAELHVLPIEPAHVAYGQVLGPTMRVGRMRRHGGKCPGPHPRQPCDGLQQQVRQTRPGDGKQVGTVHRLLHALRRHGRRAGAHRRRAKDGRLQAGRPAQRRGRLRADSTKRDYQAAQRGTQAQSIRPGQTSAV